MVSFVVTEPPLSTGRLVGGSLVVGAEVPRARRRAWHQGFRLGLAILAYENNGTQS